MLTPLDIQNKEFGKGFRGYKEIEVDSFLDEVIADYEFVFKENLELKSKIDMLNEQIRSFSSMETTLQKTLVVAQNTAEEVIQSAREQEDSIIAQAERRSNKITESARDQVIDSQKEYETIRKEIMMFKNKYKSLLTAQLDTIDHYSEDNVFSVLDDMKEKDFEFANRTEKLEEEEPKLEIEVETKIEPELELEEEQSYEPVEEYVEPEPELELEPETESQQYVEPEFDISQEEELQAEDQQVAAAQIQEEVKPEPIFQEPEVKEQSAYEQAYAQVQTEAEKRSESEIEFKEQDLSEDNMVSQSFQPEFKPQFSLKPETPVDNNPFADSYTEEEEEGNDGLGFYIENLEDDKDDPIEDLSNHTKRPILD